MIDCILFFATNFRMFFDNLNFIRINYRQSRYKLLQFVNFKISEFVAL
jgi:hypothetical protein